MEIYNGTWSVYYHVNKINGKIYIGITSKIKVNERWRNGKGYMDTPHFKRAILKYGWNNFDHIVYASNLTEEEACNMEKLLIKKLGTNNAKYGYNISEGGNKGCLLRGENHPMFGRHHSETTKKKISDKKKGTHIAMTEQAKNKISQALKGNHNMPTTKVLCVETGIIYNSAAEAARDTNSDPSSILKCARNKMHKTNNLHWKLVA